MQISHLSLIAAAALLAIVPVVISDNVQERCALGPKDYGSSDWYGPVPFDGINSDDGYTSRAYKVEKFNHHNYAFNVSIDVNKWATVDISTKKGKKDRLFKINFLNDKGEQAASLTSRAEFPCGTGELIDKSEVVGFSLQEANLG